MLDLPQQILSDVVIWSKYAKYIPEIGRREDWTEICERNMAMHIKKFPHLKDEIQRVYKQYVIPKHVLPSMRSMQFGGKPIDVNNTRMFNCFSIDTRFVTDMGVVSFRDVLGKTVNVLASDGVYRPAQVNGFGEQELHKVVLKTKFKSNLRHTFEVTKDHRWILKDGSVTTNLKVGDRVRANVDSASAAKTGNYTDGFAHGVVFGDGTKHSTADARFVVRLCGDKATILEDLRQASDFRTVSYPPSFGGDPVAVFVSDVDLKALPKTESADYIAGFIAGWLFCDGYKKSNTDSWTIDTQDRDAADWLIESLPIAGYIATGISVADNVTNYGPRSAPLNRVSFRNDYEYFIVDSIEYLRRGLVYCVTEPVTSSFTLAGGVLTGNCAYAPVDSAYAFSEAMFLLLGGTGYGYSVQQHHISKLPSIQGPNAKNRKFLIGDSIEGWADAIKVLMRAYFEGRSNPVFDYRDIRPKGSRLITAGGKAPGPDPLRICIEKIKTVLNGAIGRKLTSLECHDILCHIADAVLSGGIRRAAMIAFFSHTDIEMMSCKAGPWYELNPQRGRANNSVVLLRSEIDEETFKEIWKRVEESGSGEPGIYWTHDKEILSNPCVEATLNPHSFCNLTTTNVGDVYDQATLNERVKAAAFIGTLQASYTDFHYLRDIWKDTTEEDALIGVSMTGIASGGVMALDLEEAAKVVVAENARIAALIGINTAARTSLNKPEGTASLVVGSASGVHAWHNDYYIRRMRIGKNEAIYKYLVEKMPNAIEDCHFKPHIEAVASFPQKAPEGAILRSESVLDMFARVIDLNQRWIAPGHNRGVQRHNVSCTFSLLDTQWEPFGVLMWKFRDVYNGMSVLPYDGGSYIQAPFEDCTKEVYEAMMMDMAEINVNDIIEVEDNTAHTMEAACAGGACEVK